MPDIDRKTPLSDAQIGEALAELRGWQRDGQRLVATFEFDDFVGAFGFMSGVALIAERLFHHPEWSNVYGKVDIAITNHAAGALTAIDVEFCRRVSALRAMH